MFKESPVPIPQWLLQRFPSDRRAAVDYLRHLIDESMLREIAEADYAQEVEEHLVALEPIWNGEEWEELDTWLPREVLQLTRWSEPADVEGESASSGLRDHAKRAFSCAVLLAASNFEPDKETLIQWVDSVSVLGPEPQEATARFLVSRLETLTHDEDRPFFVLAVIALAQSLEPSLSLSKEQDLADWLAHEELSERTCLAGFDDRYLTAPWLFGLSFNDMLNRKWESLIQRVRESSGHGPLGRVIMGHESSL